MLTECAPIFLSLSNECYMCAPELAARLLLLLLVVVVKYA